MNLKKLVYTAGLGLCLMSGHASAAIIALMDGSHDMEFGANTTAAGVGIDGLGHTYNKFGNTALNWSTVLSGSYDAVIIEENAATNASSVAIANYINNGGRVIVAGYTGVNGLIDPCNGGNSLYGALFGVSYATTCAYFDGYNSNFYNATSATLGTSFAGGPTGLSAPSSVHSITTALAANSTVFYQNNTYGAQVVRTTLGLGDFFHIGFDYCCGVGATQEADYYSVLNNAISFQNAPVKVPEPATLGLLGLSLLAMRNLRKKI